MRDGNRFFSAGGANAWSLACRRARPVGRTTGDAIAIDELVAAAGVAKDSFFSHFKDKRAFARAISEGIRREVEVRVAAINTDVPDPLERLAGGMIAATGFALTERKRMVVLAEAGRGLVDMAHPLNDGVRRDIADAAAAHLIQSDAMATGALFWLGCCHTAASMVAQQRLDRTATLALLNDMLALGLRGLGVDVDHLARVAAADRLDERLR